MTAQILAGLGLGVLVVSLSGCQSTQDKSAELEAEGATSLLKEKGLVVKKESNVVRVTSTTLLSDASGTAVVVGVHNDSAENLTDVPILIHVLNAKGKTVYSNDTPGIEPALASIPYVAAHGDAEWVNDQVLATGRPKSLKVKIGAGGSSFSGQIPDIEVSQPSLEGDPVSGISATGTVVNRSGDEQGRLLLYVVAKRGGRVVAAGRGAIEHLKATTKKLPYTVFFIGEPRGAELKLSVFPSLSTAQ